MPSLPFREPRTETITAGGKNITVHKNLRIPMRDGVHLSADAYHKPDDVPRPALIALSPYGKELQAYSLYMPAQYRPSVTWDGCIEAGDIARVVDEDYVHVIGDIRGSGYSEGEHIGNYNAGGVSLGEDAYDLIQWVAEQPWCDGNVGMIGTSYFGSMSVLAAAENPPALKAIFVNGGHYDFYETTYHGGVMWLMPRAAREGRGGDSGWAFTENIKSRMLEEFTPEEIEKKVAERLRDPDVAAWPNMFHNLMYPLQHEAWFDIVMNDLDGEWYEERNPITLAPNITVPTYLQIAQGRGWTMDGTIALFNAVQGPKKLDVLPYPPMNSRPFVDAHDEMFRWYDHFLKGKDNGITDEPTVSVHVEGSDKTVSGAQFPVTAPTHRPLYLRPRHILSTRPEDLGVEWAAPDTMTQLPMMLSNDVAKLSWSMKFTEPTEMQGTGAAHIFAAIDQDDTNFILRFWDVAPSGKRQLITTGYLKASHNELSPESTPGNPIHPHTSKTPVTPGEINEYVIRVYPFAATFQPGHTLLVELSNNEPVADEHNAMLPPDAFHLPIGRATTTKIYRDAEHQSHLLLPFVD
ncbi:CocE/NonD family hydrolase [Corynebacterium lubricantis]|uniref:CocE/NonD family hydrolase n=1 Tax=Corynebacterium lubricantis TaxID=541095 RepID=UPI00037E11BE|nr:CocE/NonD family hydrolase [Corynebacterium lubricantis]